MIREEAIRYCDEYLERHIADIDKEFLKIAKEALQQEPCDDAISRQAVNILVDELARAISDERCCMPRGRSTGAIMQDILDLPPVTPQQKMGYWIDEKDGYGTRCSKCKKWYPHSIITKHEVLYCSSCGAKMQEVKDNG